jgi:sugar phosphate permease
LLLLGSTITTPYYIPSSLYTTRFGGNKYCGTLAGAFDGFGYLCSFVIDFFIGYVSDEYGWGMALFMMMSLGLLSIITMISYQLSLYRLPNWNEV